MIIRNARLDDADVIVINDVWISRDTLLKRIAENFVYVVFDDDKFVGWLRYGLFWDNTPFMNMLYLLEPYRGKGIGKKLTTFWENEMRELGYKMVMTSTQADEKAQYFYRKLGYTDRGCLVLDNTPLKQQPLELFMLKIL